MSETGFSTFFCIFLAVTCASHAQTSEDNLAATGDKTVVSDQSQAYPQSNRAPSTIAEKKNAPKEGVKEVHPGPSPEKAPRKRTLVKPSRISPRNPVDIMTGKELIPWTDNGPQKSPEGK